MKKLKPDDKELIGKPLMKRVMQAWLPASEALLEMMIWHLPSPAFAQRYRVDCLYEGEPATVAAGREARVRAWDLAFDACVRVTWSSRVRHRSQPRHLAVNITYSPPHSPPPPPHCRPPG